MPRRKVSRFGIRRSCRFFTSPMLFAVAWRCYSLRSRSQERQRLLRERGVSGDSAVVWVLSGERQYRPVAVKPLLTDYVYTAVDSEELKPGMRVGMRPG